MESVLLYNMLTFFEKEKFFLHKALYGTKTL